MVEAVTETTTTTNTDVGKPTISTVVIIIAMQTEALPLVNKLQLSQDHHFVFPEGVPWVRYHGVYKDLQVNITWPGKDLLLSMQKKMFIDGSLDQLGAV
ncbi:5'-methylthioadenosine/S-adenosylhomocysteine nucleosidase 1 [Acorus calamus]|uniref:5'-methylthioadenosine/S-adenosylhomocysteine nucleosidase 1 n=1 Tax=Acorus calamus TaxID=4465 RepID=A0AAV9FG50_ACOCL|nr:5'-methylthioadenosine/S-adenosylhomocysteine nucleosidase 1 [Acorus calamus]